MVVLGVDPGSRVTGYGMVKIQKYDLVRVCYGQIVTSPRDTLASFLARLYDTLSAVVEKHSPDAMAVEDIFYGKNVKSLIKQGHVRGVVILAASKRGIPIYEYTPLEVKKAVVGYGRAEKAQVQRMVHSLLHLDEIPAIDTADALAVAICHAHTRAGRVPLGSPYGCERVRRD